MPVGTMVLAMCVRQVHSITILPTIRLSALAPFYFKLISLIKEYLLTVIDKINIFIFH